MLKDIDTWMKAPATHIDVITTVLVIAFILLFIAGPGSRK